MTVIIQARRNEERLEIALQPFKHQLALEWVSELKRLGAARVPILERDRIYSLNDKWDREAILKRIRDCWETIEAWNGSLGRFRRTHHTRPHESTALGV